MTTYAIRSPGKGKAHRLGYTVGPTARLPVSACGMFKWGSWFDQPKRVPLADVSPGDLCKRCWPNGATP